MKTHHAICHLIHCAVSPGTDNIIISGAVLDHCVFRIILPVCCHQCHNEICLTEHLDDICQLIPDLLLTCHGIVNE